MSYQPIENYGAIGNMRSVALVGMNGSIDFLCYPTADSPTVFAALLDEKRGGSFRIRPELNHRKVRQQYLPETNILLTRFLADDGVAELTDYMPLSTARNQPDEIIRRVAVVKGEVSFEMLCAPRFNYAKCTHTARIEHNCVTFSPQTTECPAMALHASIPITTDGQNASAKFMLRAGQQATFIFGAAQREEGRPEMARVNERFHETARFWKAWI